VSEAPRVKICGLTRAEDARLAADLGAWACGMVLSPRGPRALTLERAFQVRHAIPKGVLAVGVLVDEPVERIHELARELALDLVQLHGNEAPALLDSLSVPAIKAISIDVAKPRVDLESVKSFGKAWGVLFDAKVGANVGGTGRSFSWEVLEGARAVVPEGRLVLAGGLNAENVAEALERVKPYAVDLASGVESSPGVKDRGKLERLFDAVRGVP
jgi:phosphoribosylanthranilate isomerase